MPGRGTCRTALLLPLPLSVELAFLLIHSVTDFLLPQFTYSQFCGKRKTKNNSIFLHPEFCAGFALELKFCKEQQFISLKDNCQCLLLLWLLSVGC